MQEISFGYHNDCLWPKKSVNVSLPVLWILKKTPGFCWNGAFESCFLSAGKFSVFRCICMWKSFGCCFFCDGVVILISVLFIVFQSHTWQHRQTDSGTLQSFRTYFLNGQEDLQSLLLFLVHYPSCVCYCSCSCHCWSCMTWKRKTSSLPQRSACFHFTLYSCYGHQHSAFVLPNLHCAMGES